MYRIAAIKGLIKKILIINIIFIFIRIIIYIYTRSSFISYLYYFHPEIMQVPRSGIQGKNWKGRSTRRYTLHGTCGRMEVAYREMPAENFPCRPCKRLGWQQLLASSTPSIHWSFPRRHSFVAPDLMVLTTCLWSSVEPRRGRRFHQLLDSVER